MDDADDDQAVAVARHVRPDREVTKRRTHQGPTRFRLRRGSRPSTIPRPVAFETLGLEPSLIEGIRVRGFTSTTPIQSAVIPIVMDGSDLIGCADTGTGKTAAFLLPILNRMLKARATAPEERGFTRVLILAPTRELCSQIEDDVQGFTYHTDLTSIAVYGGAPMDPQERALKSGVDIVAATPGRLMDHMRNGAVKFDKLDTLVLDEADRMMDMGFWPDVRRIVSALPDTAARQTLLFSATMPEEVMKLADEVVCDAKFVQVGSAGGPAKSITHTIENVAAAQKTEWLAKFLRRADGPVLVFVRTKSGAERLARRLAAGGLKAAALHANRTQAAADAGGRRIPQRSLPRARRHRRRRARPGHRRHHARRQLRSAVEPRNLRAPRRTDGTRRGHRHGAHARGPRRAARAAGAATVVRDGTAGLTPSPWRRQ